MSQSIDLSAVTDATFNSSLVEQINLNGVEIWSGGVTSMFYLKASSDPSNPNNLLYDPTKSIGMPNGTFITGGYDYYQAGIYFINDKVYLTMPLIGGYGEFTSAPTQDQTLQAEIPNGIRADNIPVTMYSTPHYEVPTGEGHTGWSWPNDFRDSELTKLGIGHHVATKSETTASFYCIAEVTTSGFVPLGNPSYATTGNGQYAFQNYDGSVRMIDILVELFWDITSEKVVIHCTQMSGHPDDYHASTNLDFRTSPPDIWKSPANRSSNPLEPIWGNAIKPD